MKPTKEKKKSRNTQLQIQETVPKRHRNFGVFLFFFSPKRNHFGHVREGGKEGKMKKLIRGEKGHEGSECRANEK